MKIWVEDLLYQARVTWKLKFTTIVLVMIVLKLYFVCIFHWACVVTKISVERKEILFRARLF